MANDNELLLSASDAALVASLRLLRDTMAPAEAEAADDLADALAEARTVPGERLPRDRVSMNCRVQYVEEPGGVRRRVLIVHPREANAAEGRISVLSPVARALLGRRRGAVACVEIPGARALALRVVSIEPRGLGEAR